MQKYHLKIYDQGMSGWLPGWNKRVGLRLLPAWQQPTVGVQLRRLLTIKYKILNAELPEKEKHLKIL